MTYAKFYDGIVWDEHTFGPGEACGDFWRYRCTDADCRATIDVLQPALVTETLRSLEEIIASLREQRDTQETETRLRSPRAPAHRRQTMSVDPTDHDVTDALAEWRALRKEHAALRKALDLALRRVHLFSPTCLGAFELCTTMACVEGRAAAALTGAPREEP